MLVHPSLVPPDSLTGFSADAINEWKTEYNVVHPDNWGTLVRVLRGSGRTGAHPPAGGGVGAARRLQPARRVPGITEFDQRRELSGLLRVPYTGCNPRGLTIARDGALSKIAAYATIDRRASQPFTGDTVRRPKDLSSRS